MEKRFASEEDANKHHETNELVLLPTYNSKRTSKLKTVDVPPEINVVCLVAAVMLDLESNVSVLQVMKLHQQNGKDKGLEIIIQARSRNYTRF